MTLQQLAEQDPFLYAMWQHQTPKTLRGLVKHVSKRTGEFIAKMADAMELEGDYKITVEANYGI